MPPDAVPWFELVVVVVAFVAGATASVVGFGIGSLLTPLMAWRVGAPLAIAAVTIPHAVATALRCWRLRRNIDHGVLSRFGILSAVGGVVGAFAYASAGGALLTRVLGVLLILTSIAQLVGVADRWHPRGRTVAALGLLSGAFGGVAGNQGGLRAAALSSFRLTPAAFVATSTAIGLLVDAVRAPVYLVDAGPLLVGVWVPIVLASAGVIAGTLLGERIMLGVPRRQFGRVVAVAVGLLGLWLLAGSIAA